MPFNVTGHDHITGYYVLPTGATGTQAQLTNFGLADILGIQSFDVGITGAVWLNNGNWAISKGATGP